MRASVETLRTVASVEEKRLAPLNLGKLVPQTFNLSTPFQPDPSHVSGLETCLRRCYQRWEGRNLGQHPNGPHPVSTECY